MLRYNSVQETGKTNRAKPNGLVRVGAIDCRNDGLAASASGATNIADADCRSVMPAVFFCIVSLRRVTAGGVLPAGLWPIS